MEDGGFQFLYKIVVYLRNELRRLRPVIRNLPGLTPPFQGHKHRGVRVQFGREGSKLGGIWV